MELDLAVEDVRYRVFVLAEFNSRPCTLALSYIGVSSDVLAVYDGLDETVVARFIDLLLVGQNEAVAPP